MGRHQKGHRSKSTRAKSKKNWEQASASRRAQWITEQYGSIQVENHLQVDSPFDNEPLFEQFGKYCEISLFMSSSCLHLTLFL